MDEITLLLPKQDIRKLLSAASGDAALLYLYLRMGFDPAQAREALHLNVHAYDCALASLRQMGLIEEKPRFLEPGERPVYTEQDIAREIQSGREFGLLVGEVQRRLGRVLSTEELKILLAMRDYLRLPDEVISILISFCIERSRARGNVRTPSMRSIEKEAYYWADNGIDTLEEGVAYMQQQLNRQNKLGGIRRALQINDRRLTPTEEKYICKWIDMGYGEPEIALAYDRTCLNIGSLKWPYMDSIFASWQKQNLYTVDQIKQFDKAPARTAAPARRGNVEIARDDKVDPIALKAMQRLMNRNSGEEG